MGVVYRVIMLDEFDWGYKDTDKTKKMAEFENEARKLGCYCFEKIGDWYGGVAFDFDKWSPCYGPNKAVIEKYCDSWYYIQDNQLTVIERGGR